MLKEKDKNFLVGWLSSLVAVWYICVGVYKYDPYILEIVFWPFHTHDININVIESTIDWQTYIDKLNRDLEVGTLYIEETIEEVINDTAAEEPDTLKLKLDKWIKTER